MKLKPTLATMALCCAMTAGNALADDYCSLGVNPSPFIQVGQSFSLPVEIKVKLLPGPLPPYRPGPPFTVVFYGSKNGVADIPPWGEIYPGSFSFGVSNLTGYVNPGGVGGLYERYAVIYDGVLGMPYCTTNSVYVYLFN